MTKKLVYFLVLFSALLVSVSCSRTQPIQNIPTQSVAATGLSASQVKKCIELAGASRGWKMTEVKSGLIRGVINTHGHHAEIDIPYSSAGYAINYASSQNLKAKEGLVHRNYNKWIKLLDKGIQKYLAQEHKAAPSASN